MLKVAIVGCGKIADAHASQILRVRNCELVGVCDREELMARQLFDRFPVRACFQTVEDLLARARPDVVHITTPPQTHFTLGKQCLEAGCHVYMEKPFTLFTSEAKELFELAERKRLKVTVGHDEQFSHPMRRMRQMVRAGYLGQGPVHMECTWCYGVGDAAQAKALLGAQNWVRQLPGKLLHNVISHGIAKIAEFLSDDSPTVIARGSVSPVLKSLGEEEAFDELRVMILQGDGTSAYFTLSSQMKPALHQLCLYGTRNGLVIDEDQQTLLELRGGRYKSYLEKFLPPAIFARLHLRNMLGNVRLFLANDFHVEGSKKHLFECFYRSIIADAPAPIPYREILLTSRIMDAIFEQLASQRRESWPVAVPV